MVLVKKKIKIRLFLPEVLFQIYLKIIEIKFNHTMNLTLLLFLIGGVLDFVLNRKNIILMSILIEIMLYITYLILQSSIDVHFLSLTSNPSVVSEFFISVIIVLTLALLVYIASVYFSKKVGVSGPYVVLNILI